MTTSSTAYKIGSLIGFAIGAACVWGYILNVIAILGAAFSAAPVTALFVARLAGMFIAPLGVVLGYVG